MMDRDQLLVIWGAPDTGSRHVIGRLARIEGEFRFWYERDRSEAERLGFQLLMPLPEDRDEQHPYTSGYLFTMFASRIPSPARSDTAGLLASWGVDDPDDVFEILAKSGGIRATDTIELAPYRAPDDSLAVPLEFRVASRRHLKDAAPLAIGARVSLRREPENPKDACAVIVDRDGRTAGYVPRHYSALVCRLLDEGVALDGEVIRQLQVPETVGKWVVRMSRPTP